MESIFYRLIFFLLVCKVFGNIPGKSDRLKREASWLDISFLKSLRLLVGILFGLTVLWLFWEEMMLEISLQAVSEVLS